MKAQTDVLIVGGVPCGLMLANELGRRGIEATLVDEKPGTTQNVQANATQARTMEHYRRLGFADDVRALGMPPDPRGEAAGRHAFGILERGRAAAPLQPEIHRAGAAQACGSITRRLGELWMAHDRLFRERGIARRAGIGGR